MIRKATRDDLKIILDLFHMEYSETRARAALMPYKLECITTCFARTLVDPRFGMILVKELDGVVIGYIYGRYMPGWDGDFSYVYLQEIAWYVLLDHRKQGYGLELFQAMEDAAREDGIATAICVSTAIGVDHEHMLRKYEEAGFTPLQIMSFKNLGV